MSKNICDLCGSTFPEDADRCPVCGTAKTDTTVQQEEKATVSRRRPKRRGFGAKIKDGCVFLVESARANLGLAIAVVLLILAIVAVCIFIAVSLNDPASPHNNNTSSTPPVGSSSSSDPVRIACTAIDLPENQLAVLLDLESTVLRLMPQVQPLDTTDLITYTSSDPTIATVDANGVVTAVADGEAVITVACGGFSAQCTVVCQLTPPEEPLKLNHTDITLDGYGSSWNLAGEGYTGPDPERVTWISSDDAVVTVENGKVVALANSSAGVTITAEYGDQKVTCIVRCKNVVPPVEVKYEWSHPGFNGVPDVTVASGWSYDLYLRDKDTKEKVDVELTISDESFCVFDADGKLKVLDNTTGKIKVIKITAKIGDETYTFTIRIKPLETEEA